MNEENEHLFSPNILDNIIVDKEVKIGIFFPGRTPSKIIK
jgi:hypothetical protein